jgi:translation initiation factor 3 subunit C
MQFTAESIFKNLQLVQEARGKKVCIRTRALLELSLTCPQNTDRVEQIRILEKLSEVASTPYQSIRVLLALVSSRFDYNSSVANYMPVDLWIAARREVDQLISIVASNPSYSIQELTDDYDEMLERTPTEEKDGIVRVRGSIISFVDRLDDEFTKSLQHIDPHGNEYVDRLKDEPLLYCTICQAQALYETTGETESLSRVIMRRLEHIYSKVTLLVFHTSMPFLLTRSISLTR